MDILVRIIEYIFNNLITIISLIGGILAIIVFVSDKKQQTNLKQLLHDQLINLKLLGNWLYRNLLLFNKYINQLIVFLLVIIIIGGSILFLILFNKFDQLTEVMQQRTPYVAIQTPLPIQSTSRTPSQNPPHTKSLKISPTSSSTMCSSPTATPTETATATPTATPTETATATPTICSSSIP